MTWAALAPLIPLFVRIAGKLLDKLGANEEQKKETLKMIVDAGDDPLVGIQMKDDFDTLHAKLKERLASQGPDVPKA